MSVETEIREILLEHPNSAIDFVLANQEDFLHYLINNEKVNNITTVLEQNVVNEEDTEADTIIPNVIKELEKAYEDAKDIDYKPFMTGSCLDEITLVNKPKFLENLTMAIASGEITKEEVHSLLERLGLICKQI